MLAVSGPYKYKGDVHPCYRLETSELLVAVVYDPDGHGEERACRLAAAWNREATNETLAAALEKSDWSGVSVGNKQLIIGAAARLRGNR